MNTVWAALPVKERAGAKQRLAGVLTPEQRRALATAMLEDVLAALAAAPLAGILVNTLDPDAAALALRHGAVVMTEGARDGHTGAVAAMARRLAGEGRVAMLALPGDLPLLTSAEIAALCAAAAPAPSFTIAPSRDALGSNGVLLTPPLCVKLRFGEDSFFPHLAAARAAGIEPTILRLPGFGLDIDTPEDLAELRAASPAGRVGAVLRGFALAG